MNKPPSSVLLKLGSKEVYYLITVNAKESIARFIEGKPIKANRLWLVDGGISIDQNVTILSLSMTNGAQYCEFISHLPLIDPVDVKSMISDLQKRDADANNVLKEDVPVIDDSPIKREPVGSVVVFSFQGHEPQRGIVTKLYAATYNCIDLETVMRNFYKCSEWDKLRTVREITGISRSSYQLSDFEISLVSLVDDRTISCVVGNIYDAEQLTRPTEALNLVDYLYAPIDKDGLGLAKFHVDLRDVFDKNPT